MNSSVLFKVMIHDFKYLFRGRLMAASAGVILVYTAVLSILPKESVPCTAAFFILTDTGALGAFFAGAVVLTEKTSGIIRLFGVIPEGRKYHAAAQTASLSSVSAFAGFLLLTAAFVLSGTRGPADISEILKVMSAVLMLGTLFTFSGILIALKSDSLNHFFFRSVILIVPWFIPLIFLIFPGRTSLFAHLSPLSSAAVILFSFPAPGCRILPSLINAELQSLHHYISIPLLLLWNAAAAGILIKKYN